MNTKKHLHHIRDEQKRIRTKIDKINKQLKRLESVPGAQPWISFHRVQTIEELKSPFPTLKDALKHDLTVLKSKLRDLNRMALATRVQAANRAREDFRREAYEKLKEAEKDGGPTESELADLRSKAESVLKRYVNILKVNPSEKNMENVLANLEAPLVFGSDSDSGVAGEAFHELSSASEKLVTQREKEFRRTPTSENFDKLLGDKERAMLVGGKTQDRPANFKPANTTHIVARGESLSEISRRYYGNQGYWDVIYMENYGVIGNDPDTIQAGITLQIP
jgi:nucleoid-associated protein YgaU